MKASCAVREAEFVSLAAALRPPIPNSTPLAEPISSCADPTGAEDGALSEMLGDLALARLAALEAYDRAVPRLVEALARDVLGRELILAPADIAKLAANLRGAFAADGPVGLVVSAGDAARFAGEFPVRIDPRLKDGDLVLEVRDGEIDASFPLRCRLAIEDATT